LIEGDVFRTIIPLTAIPKPANPLEGSPDVPVNNSDVPINDPAALILNLMTSEPGISLDMIAKKIGKTRKTVQRAVKKLKESGRVKRVGPDKTGHWEVID
jgi:predicted HTH transcriptional regulator